MPPPQPAESLIPAAHWPTAACKSLNKVFNSGFSYLFSLIFLVITPILLIFLKGYFSMLSYNAASRSDQVPFLENVADFEYLKCMQINSL